MFATFNQSATGCLDLPHDLVEVLTVLQSKTEVINAAAGAYNFFRPRLAQCECVVRFRRPKEGHRAVTSRSVDLHAKEPSIEGHSAVKTRTAR